ncbi:MAG TPA: hypothetical protein VMX36_11640 [Sedimentisphaerales bacterium]|nr:hypothetical protein [Sedimentisphaerales bacterium]
MEINKRNRTELKSYFVRNAIPTESNFAELIDAMLNQKDDGIVKLAGDPLSIEAAGGDTSKKVINFYQNFTDTNPSWVLSLNPGGKPGFNISDGQGNSRLFIDQNTGNVGIGTPNPTSKLEVNGDLAVTGDQSFGSQTRQMINLWSTNYGIGVQSSTQYYRTDKNFAWYKGGSHHDSELNAGGGTVQMVIKDGNVGIGTANPGNYKLNISGTNGQNVLHLASDFGLRGDNRLNLIKFGNDGDYQILHKSSGAFERDTLAIHVHTNDSFGVYSTGWRPLFEIKGGSGDLYARGSVGIGTTNPQHKLDVAGNLRVQGTIVQEAWQNVAANKFQSGWVNYGGPYNPAGYFKDSLGIVHLRGLVKGGAVGTNATIFTLPSGYRPQNQELQVTITNGNASCRIDIAKDGRVIPSSGSPGWFSLDGITFRAAPLTLVTPVTPITPVTPFTPFTPFTPIHR